MSQRITLTVTSEGVPLIGAEVLVSDIVGSALTTDENGQVAFLVDDGFAAYAHLLITTGSAPSVVVLARLIGGETYEISI